MLGESEEKRKEEPASIATRCFSCSYPELYIFKALEKTEKKIVK